MQEIRRKNWAGQRLFVGLDLHKKNWVATVRSRDLHLKTFTVPSGEEAFWKTLNHQFPGAQFIVAYEAGCFGYHIAEYINNNGGKAVIFPPHRIPTPPGVFVKTDKIDSRKLASELSKGLDGIYQPDRISLYHRSVIRKRSQLVQRKVEIQNQIKSDLLFYGIQIDTLGRYWSAEFLRRLWELEFVAPGYTRTFRIILREYEEIVRNIKETTDYIKEMAQSDLYKERVCLLKSVPGVGDLSAMTILLEIFDINRFASAEKFASYVGLVPSEYSSGEKIRKGSLSGMGNKTLRSLLIEVSWVVIRKDPVLFEKYNRVKKGKTGAEAIVSVANSLARRIHYVLTNRSPYCLGVVA